MRLGAVVAILALPGTARGQDSRFEVEFLAHAANLESPGHAWVCIYRGPNVGPPARVCVGFFPKSAGDELLALLSAKDRPSVVQTSSVDDGRKATVAYRGRTTAQGYAAVEHVIADWKKSGYNIKWRNCADFVEAVAMAAGFNTPNHPGVKYPTTYIKSLADANPGSLSAVPVGT